MRSRACSGLCETASVIDAAVAKTIGFSLKVPSSDNLTTQAAFTRVLHLSFFPAPTPVFHRSPLYALSRFNQLFFVSTPPCVTPLKPVGSPCNLRPQQRLHTLPAPSACRIYRSHSLRLSSPLSSPVSTVCAAFGVRPQRRRTSRPLPAPSVAWCRACASNSHSGPWHPPNLHCSQHSNRCQGQSYAFPRPRQGAH